MSLCGSAFLLTISLGILSGHCGSALEMVVELMSYNYPDYYIGVEDTTSYRAVIKRSAKPDQWKMIHPGLCGVSGSASYQLKGTNRYLRVNQENKLYADPVENTDQYKKDACFVEHSEIYPKFVILANVQYSNKIIRHHTNILQLDYFNGTSHPQDFIKEDASFQILQPKCVKLQSYNFPEMYFGLNEDAAYIKTTPTRWILTHGLYTPCPTTETVTIRSCDDATKFLHYRPKALWLYEDKFSSTNSDLFRKQASFILRHSKFFEGYGAFESADHSNYFIRHRNRHLEVNRYSDDLVYKKDASFRSIPA